MDVPLIAGTIATVAFAVSNLPMLRKALRTRDVSSYSLPSMIIINIANGVYSLYVFTLPFGPIWGLHTFYVVSCAIMLALCVRQGRAAVRQDDRGVRPDRLVGAERDSGGSLDSCRTRTGVAMPSTLQDLLGIEEPIVLGPFGGVSSIELTAIVSAAGGLGSYGLYGYSAERIDQTMAALRAVTSRPFAVNLWLPTGDEVSPADLDLTLHIQALLPLYDELRVPAPEPPVAFMPDFDSQVDAVLDGAPKVVSFVYGVPPAR